MSVTLREDLRQFKAAIISCARALPPGEAVAFPAYEMTFFRKGNLVGAAIPTGEALINIHNVHPGKSYTLDGDNSLPGVPGNFLTLTVNTDKTNLRDDVLCSEFADRVLSFVKLEGETRNLLLANPWEWAERIIEMTGDALSSKMVHPMLAELYLLNGLRDAGLLTDVVNEYRGPTGGTHDFELPGMSLECKSRLHGDRTSRAGELVVSSEHQLSPTGKKPLYVVYCPMEESGNESLERCVEHFGEPRADIMAKLEEAGFAEGDFAWKETFRFLGDPLVYEINDAFPRITPAQFPEGRFPAGITKLVYHVSLKNLPFCPLGAFIEAAKAGNSPVFSI